MTEPNPPFPRCSCTSNSFSNRDCPMETKLPINGMGSSSSFELVKNSFLLSFEELSPPVTSCFSSISTYKKGCLTSCKMFALFLSSASIHLNQFIEVSSNPYVVVAGILNRVQADWAFAKNSFFLSKHSHKNNPLETFGTILCLGT